MKIKVKDLQPNPYRQIKRYPIDRAKVEALKTSISQTSFWDNILVRKHKGKFQIAYGHHRLIALKELKIKEIDVPIRDLDDATMLKIMAEENLDWATSPAVINETVRAVKDYLDGELAKSWKDSDKNIRVLFDSKHAYEQAMRKKEGVGRPTILKFLGSNWQGWMIQEALDTLRDKTVDRKAVEVIPTFSQAKIFRKAVKDYNIPKPKQMNIAKEIAKNEIGLRDVRDKVRAEAVAETKKGQDKNLEELKKLVIDIDEKARTLQNKIKLLRAKIEKLNVVQLKGIRVSLAKGALKRLVEEIIQFEGKESKNAIVMQNHG